MARPHVLPRPLRRLWKIVRYRFQITSLGRKYTARRIERRFERLGLSPDEIDFGRYYADRQMRKLEKGRAHPSLGNKRWSSATGQSRGTWTSATFAQHGAAAFALFTRHGLAPGMRCVDYGCGSLRLGQHAIRMLGPDAYIGLDVTSGFFDIGLELLSPELIAEKKPRLHVISDPILQAISEEEPDFIFCYGVMQHVPPGQLDQFLTRLTSLMSERSRAAIVFASSKRDTHSNSMSWSYDPEGVRDRVARIRPGLAISLSLANGARSNKKGIERTLMRVDGPDWATRHPSEPG